MADEWDLGRGFEFTKCEGCGEVIRMHVEVCVKCVEGEYKCVPCGRIGVARLRVAARSERGSAEK